jgi:hypothetical protein
MKIELEISPQRIADMMIGAVEHNPMTRAWCAGVFLGGAWKLKEHQLKSPWYSDPQLYAGPFTLEIHEMPDERLPTKVKKRRVNQDDFAAGLALMAKKYGKHFGDMLNENDDNITQDVFLQCVALRELVYG